jgi:hypothetical protein
MGYQQYFGSTVDLTSALAALAPALKPTPRFVEVIVLLKDGEIQAFNGTTYSWCPIPEYYGPVALSAEKLQKVWSEQCTMSVAEKFTTITKVKAGGKTRYKLSQKYVGDVFFPPRIEGGRLFPSWLKDAIKAARVFMSENALHLWANAIMIHPTGVIATNNQILVKIPVANNFGPILLPPWALDILFSTDQLPYFSFNDNTIRFDYENGAVLQAQRLEVELPDKFIDFANSLTPASIPVGDIAADLEDVGMIGGRFCTFDNYTLTVDGSNGESAVTETEIAGSFKMNVQTAQLVFSVATHIDFRDAPHRLRFSDNRTGLVGIATGAI